jgi:hypothetical protein
MSDKPKHKLTVNSVSTVSSTCSSSM